MVLMVVYRFARGERRESTAPKRLGYKTQVRSNPLQLNGSVPEIYRFNKPVQETRYEGTFPFCRELADLIAENEGQPKGGLYQESIYRYLADSNIRLHLASGDIPYAIRTMEELAKSHYVPNHKTVNAILREMIKVYNHPSAATSTPSVLSLPIQRPPLRRQALTVRAYHTAIPPSAGLPSILNYFSEPWLTRTLPSLGIRPTYRKQYDKSVLLRQLLRFLNINNINATTIKLLAKLTSSEWEVEIPWEIAHRTKHPKTIIRQSQSALVDAACNISSSSRDMMTRHVHLSRGMLVIMRLEGMGITPSRDALVFALKSCVEQGNILGARALLDRLEYYRHTLQQGDIPKLLESLPCMEATALMTPAGTLLSPMYVRTEQLQFITELGAYIKDAKSLGPYIRAVGRCGSAVEIWRAWDSVRGKGVKDGILTAIVESFVLTGDLASAMEFIKVAFKNKGYKLNFLRARAIAGAVKKGQRGIGHELLREMTVQKVGFGRVKEILHLMLSSQRLVSENGSQGQVVEQVAMEMEKMMALVREGRDIPYALNEIDRILDTARGKNE